MIPENIKAVADLVRPADDKRSAVILIGSAARNRSNESSDIDLLVVGVERPKITRLCPRFHIRASGVDEFLSKLAGGEDFEAWCLRFGITIHDGGIWSQLNASPYAMTWPKWERKVHHGMRRLFIANQLFRDGDLEASREEMIYVLGHVARGLLLKSRQFPFSRPELADQLKSIGFAHLADLHELLRNSESPHDSSIRKSIGYAKKLLIHLDRAAYARAATDHRCLATEKNRKRRLLPFREIAPT